MSPLLGDPGRTAALAKTRPRTWGAALDRFYAEQAQAEITQRRRTLPRNRRGQYLPRKKWPKRYLRPGRIQYAKPRPGWVELSIRAHIPALLNRRLRELSTFDDRTITELVILGLTWVVTEWAANRARGEDLERVKPYRLPYPKHAKKRGHPHAPTARRPHTFPARVPQTVRIAAGSLYRQWKESQRSPA